MGGPDGDGMFAFGMVGDLNTTIQNVNTYCPHTIHCLSYCSVNCCQLSAIYTKYCVSAGK